MTFHSTLGCLRTPANCLHTRASDNSNRRSYGDGQAFPNMFIRTLGGKFCKPTLPLLSIACLRSSTSIQACNSDVIQTLRQSSVVSFSVVFSPNASKYKRY